MNRILPALILSMACPPFASAQTDDPLPLIFKKHDAPVKCIAFSKEGQILASGGEDKMIYMWDLKTGEIAGSIKNYFNIRALQFISGNTILAACGADIKLMENTGKLLRTFSGYTTDIWSMDYNPGVQKLIAGSYSKLIKVWNFENGNLLLTLTGHEKSCLPVKISPAGDMAASGSLDKSVRLWDLTGGAELKKLEIHSDNIFAVDFHPSGKYVVSSSADKTLRLWDVSSGKLIRTYTGHDGSIFDVRFSADGNHMLSCGSDKTIILWETATGQALHVFTGHTAIVNAVRFSPDGRRFASASDDHTIRVWSLEKKYYIESYYSREIESATKGPLFGPRRADESRQDYAARQQEANKILSNLYDQLYGKYVEMISQQKIE